MPVLPSGSDPHRVLAGWHLPAAWCPDVCIAFPAVIASDPYVPRARSDGAVFVYANRRSELNYYLCRLRGAYPHGNPDERGQKQFSHCLLPRLHEQVYGRDGFSLFYKRRTDHMSEAAEFKTLAIVEVTGHVEDAGFVTAETKFSLRAPAGVAILASKPPLNGVNGSAESIRH